MPMLSALAESRRIEEPPDEPLVISSEPAPDLETIRHECFQKGRADGLAMAKAQSEAAAATDAATTRRLLGEIATSLADAARESGRLTEASADAVARLLLGTLAAMLPALCARHGAAEVSAVARNILPALAHAPGVVIRVSPGAAAGLEQELAQLDTELRARIVVTSADSIPDGDVRIVWQDGCANRETARLWQTIGETLAPLGLLDIAARCGADA